MNYTSTNKNNRPEGKLEPVINGGARIKKETFIDKLSKAFVKGAQYTWKELMIPAGKKMFSEAGKILWDSIIYGDTQPTVNNSSFGGVRQSSAPFVSYNRAYNSAQVPVRQASYGSEVFNTDSIIFEGHTDDKGVYHSGKQDATIVLDELRNVLRLYSIVKVADFYDLAGVSTNDNYQVNSYGWASLNTADVCRVPGTVDVYYVALPKPMPID